MKELGESYFSFLAGPMRAFLHTLPTRKNIC
jgi:hypothetical protein